jgi:hypothetical protein
MKSILIAAIVAGVAIALVVSYTANDITTKKDLKAPPL